MKRAQKNAERFPVLLKYPADAFKVNPLRSVRDFTVLRATARLSCEFNSFFRWAATQPPLIANYSSSNKAEKISQIICVVFQFVDLYTRANVRDGLSVVCVCAFRVPCVATLLDSHFFELCNKCHVHSSRTQRNQADVSNIVCERKEKNSIYFCTLGLRYAVCDGKICTQSTAS